MSNLPLIVFDLDGTLVDSAPDLVSALNFVLEREGLPAVPLAPARKMIGAGARAMIERALEAEGRFDEAAQEYDALIGYYAGLEARTRYGLLLLKQGDPGKARRLFEEVVRASGAPRIIVTDTDRDWLKVAKANL